LRIFVPHSKKMRLPFNPFIQTPDEEAILHRFESLTNITYRDIDLASHTVALSVHNLLAKQQRSLIVSNNNQDKELLWLLFSDMNIHDLVHECNINDAVTPSEWKAIRDALNTQYANPSESSLETSFRFDLADNKIKKYYSRGSEENGFVISRILQKYLQLGQDDSLTLMQVKLFGLDLSFDLKTYQQQLKDITDLAPHYQSSFELIDDVPYGESINKYAALIDNFHEASYVLFTFREESHALRSKYLLKSINIKNAFTKEKYKGIAEVDEAIQVISHKISILKSKIKVAQSKKGLMSIFTKTDNGIELVKRQIAIDIQWVTEFFNSHRCTFDVFTVDDLLVEDKYSAWYNQAKRYIEVIESRIPQLTSEYIKSINKLNFLDEELETFEHELQSLIQRLNGTKILGTVLENNTLSFVKQAETVERIIQLIDKRSLAIDTNMPYYQWLAMLTELDQNTLTILDVLRQFDKRNWVEHFNRWYYYNVLYRHTHRHHHISSQDLVQVYDLHQAVLKESSIQSKGCDVDLAKKSLKDLKKSQAEIFQKLSQDKTNEEVIYWRQLLQNAPNIIALAFPVLIVDSDALASEMKDNYHAIFYLNTRSTNPDSLQIFKTVHTYIPTNQQEKVLTDLRLDGFYIKNPKALADIPVLERAQHAMKLSTLMSNFNTVPRIFQLRKTSMIYYGQHFIADKLASELYNHGVKEVAIDEGLTATLSASWLISESAPIVIIENHLLDAQDVNSYLYQLSVLRTIEHYGATVINLDINNMWSDGINALVSDLLAVVKHENQSKSASQNQMIFEF
jgi:hypothetical protein